MLYARTVPYMEAASEFELQQVRAAGFGDQPGDMVVHWQSAFGLIFIEVRHVKTYVNGDLVEPAHESD